MTNDRSELPTDKVPAVTRRPSREALAFVEELAAHDEGSFHEGSFTVRRRLSREVWLGMGRLEALGRAVAALGLHTLVLELRTFAALRSPAWMLLDEWTIPGLTRLDLGLCYAPRKRVDFARWFETFRARHPALETTAEAAWRPAVAPRLDCLDEKTGKRELSEPLATNSGFLYFLRDPAPGESPFSVPRVGVRWTSEVGLQLAGENLAPEDTVALNGRPTSLADGLVLVHGDALQLGRLTVTVCEQSQEVADAASARALPPSASLDALRARRPAPEERRVHGWPFLKIVEGGTRTLVTTTPAGDLVRLGSGEGLAGLVRVLERLDPTRRLQDDDASWLVQHFDGWEVVWSGEEDARTWLSDSGVARTTVFLNETPGLRLRVGRRERAALRLHGELATLVTSSPGQARIERRDAAEVSAPALFHELALRFGAQGADALWRFHHFRRPGQGIATDVAVTRRDVGPFTWLELEADGWTVSVTAVDGAAVELARRRRDGPSVFEPWDEAAAMLRALLQTLEPEAVREEDWRALAPYLGTGALVGPVVCGGPILRFSTEVPGEATCRFTVELSRPPRVRVEHELVEPLRRT